MPVAKAIAILEKWKAPNAINMKYADFAKNFGFINTPCAEVPTMLKAVMMFYLCVSLFSFSAL